MGRDPKQYLMGEAARASAAASSRRLPSARIGLQIDRDPGLELRQPGFRAAFLDAMRQNREFIRRTGLPTALEAADSRARRASRGTATSPTRWPTAIC